MKTIEQWAQVMRASGASEATVRTRTGVILTLKNRAELVDSRQATRADVVAMLADCRTAWTRLTYFQAVRRWYEFLIDWGMAGEDLLKGIVKPKTPPPVPRPITDAQVRRLLSMPMQPRATAYVKLALYQALRVHEIAKLRGEDLADGWLTVRGKGDFTASIPLHAEITRLAEWFPSSGWWFPSQAQPDMPVTGRQVSLTIGAALSAAGIDATAHQLRDTAATRIQRETRNIKITQRMLRHRTIAATSKYIDVADRELMGASARLAW